MRVIITEASVLKEGYTKFDGNLFIKKVEIGRKIWARCENCSRFKKEPILIKSGQNKLTIPCDFCKNDSGEVNVKMNFELNTQGLQLPRQIDL